MNETTKQIILTKLEERKATIEGMQSTYTGEGEGFDQLSVALYEIEFAINIVNEAVSKTTNTKWIVSKDPRPFLKDEVVFSKRRGIGHVDYVDDECGNIAVKFTNEYWYDRNGNSIDDPDDKSKAIYHYNEK